MWIRTHDSTLHSRPSYQQTASDKVVVTVQLRKKKSLGATTTIEERPFSMLLKVPNDEKNSSSPVIWIL